MRDPKDQSIIVQFREPERIQQDEVERIWRALFDLIFKVEKGKEEVQKKSRPRTHDSISHL